MRAPRLGPARRLPLLLAHCVLCACGASAVPDAGTTSARDAGRGAGRDAGTDAGPLPECGTETPLSLSQCVDASRYQADLEVVAMPREPESAHWQLVQDLCATRLEELGFTVERPAYATGINVVGVREGTSEPEHRVLVGAHYDHIPGCAGADDNATGVAGALEAARVLATASYPRTLVVACWDEEERGLIGSRAYAERARARGDVIDAYFNFEMIGFTDDTPGSQSMPLGFDALFRRQAREVADNEYRGDFIAVVGDPASEAAVGSLERYADRLGLPFIPLVVPESLLDSPAIGDLRRSDHASFWAEGYPGMMITDTSEFRYDDYHCTDGPDVVENLDRDFAALVVSMTVAAAAESLGF